MQTMRALAVRATGIVATLLVATACSDVPSSPAPVPEAVPSAARSPAELRTTLREWLRGYLENPYSTPPGPAVLVGAGDIAECYQGSAPPLRDAWAAALQSPAEATAKLLDGMPGTVITIGDNAYQFGTPFDFAACYHPTWGRHRNRTRPAAGNHEYMTPGAAGHFLYFGLRSAPPLGYYSYNFGNNWHIVVLNSTPQVYMCYPPEFTEVRRDPRWPQQLNAVPESHDAGRLCPGDVAQQVWLVNDLTRHLATPCTLVYFHHPLFSSGQHGNQYQMQRIWDIMYAYGVDVVLSGHDHNYERFAKQTPNAVADPQHGIREFVVGTGGADLRPMGAEQPNSEVFINDTHGVMTLALSTVRNEYAWAFVAADGSATGTIRDPEDGPPAQESCHAPPSLQPTLPFIIGR
jgi:acid phosphatase type 7